MMRAAFALLVSAALAATAWHGSLLAQEVPASDAAKPKRVKAPADKATGSKTKATGSKTTGVKTNGAKANGNRCLSLDDPNLVDGDGDFRRNSNAEALKANAATLCIRQDIFEEGGLRWVLHIIENTKRKGPLWAVPHDNEDAAFDTAVHSVIAYGGTVVAVETGGKRNNGKQDPNRNFDAGAKPNTACPLQVAPSPIYTRRFLRWWDRSQPIMALHSNSAGGSISIKSKKNGTPFPSPKPIGGKNPDHTLIFVASVVPPARDEELGAFVGELNQRGIHVVYETVSPARNDCSMSNFAALQKIRNYFNVEVVHSDSVTQRRIVDVVMSIWPKYQIGPLRERPAPDPETVATTEPMASGLEQLAKKLALGVPDPPAPKAEHFFLVYLSAHKDWMAAEQSRLRFAKLASQVQVRVEPNKGSFDVVAGPFDRSGADQFCAKLTAIEAIEEACTVRGPFIKAGQ